MANNMPAEQINSFKNSALSKYIMKIWYGAILFFFIDILFGALITLIIYAVMVVILLIGRPWHFIPEGYIDKAMIVFCLIYLISISAITWWRHFRLIISHTKCIRGAAEDNDKQTGNEVK